MVRLYQDFLIRNWQESDRLAAASIIQSVLLEYGLPWQPGEADIDVLEVEKFYLQKSGEFWVVEQKNQIVGTAAYYPIQRGNNAVEIRKMYLLPSVRGRGLGKYLLQQLEITIKNRGFQEIWIETVSVLQEAINLYENSDYLAAQGVETARCDLVYYKKINYDN